MNRPTRDQEVLAGGKVDEAEELLRRLEVALAGGAPAVENPAAAH